MGNRMCCLPANAIACSSLHAPLPALLTPLAGGDGSTSVLSTLARGGSGNLLLRMLTARDASRFRGVCREARDAVAAHPWDDSTRVTGPLALWRSCFPHATRVNIRRRLDLVDADFVHLAGIHTLNILGCGRITDAAFVHLAGVHTLDMSHCDQITDAAFEHLAGIHTLDMSYCDQITDAAIVHLAGIHTLDMSHCPQAGFTSGMRKRLRATVPCFTWSAIEDLYA